MNSPLRRKLRALHRRLNWIEFCSRFLVLTAGAGFVFLAWLLAVRLFPQIPFRIETWWREGLAVGGVGLLGWTWWRRVRLFDAAVRADECLNLKERLSTALALGEPRNDAEAAVIEDAAACARRIDPRRAFGFKVGRELGWSASALALFALAWFFMPQLDLLAGRQTDDPGTQAQAVEVQRLLTEKLEALQSELTATQEIEPSQISKDLAREIEAMTRQIDEKKLDRESTAARLDKLADRLAERKADLEKQLVMPPAMRESTRGEQAGEVARAMQNGNFNAAAKELQAIQDALRKGAKTDADKGRLKEELEALAAKLGEESALAASLREAAARLGEGNLNEALAGLESAAGDLSAMQTMLQEFQALDALETAMKSTSREFSGELGQCQACGGPTLGDLCTSCSLGLAGLGAGGKSGLGQGVVSGPSGIGPWRAGPSDSVGPGMGRPGKGQGAVAPLTAGPTAFVPTRPNSQIQPGQIIGRMKVMGQGMTSDVSTQYESLRVEYAQQAEDTIQHVTLPLDGRSLVRNYFDAIKLPSDAKSSDAVER